MEETPRAGRSPHSHCCRLPEEAMNWLIHEPNQTSDKWRRAWQACRAAIDGRMAAEDARSAVQLAVKR
ncbi:DUF982 domain-containing protein [Rhizobium yanglingense]